MLVYAKFLSFILVPFLLVSTAVSSQAISGQTDEDQVERWGLYEIELQGPAVGNPFMDVVLSAEFRNQDSRIDVLGFYDGDGLYKIRFSPPSMGKWTYQTKSNVRTLDAKLGSFEAVAPTKRNHGPVQVVDTFHFAYADSTPYRPFGTTCYAWNHQPDPLPEQTLETLKNSPFNKLRMCVFPKAYEYNSQDPPDFPFEGSANAWDTTRFRPAFFQKLESFVGDLQTLGIEADLILLHPYDEGRWGLDRLSDQEDDRYLRYVVARLAAYRNVWWSLANEYDFMLEKQESDWDRMGALVHETDPYRRLLSNHNGTAIYNHLQPWITHASIQNGSAVADFGRAVLYRDVYRKPIVFDEVKYEGNLPQRWGNLSAEEMVHRFWIGFTEGTYVGHGETYLHPQDVIWWAKGGRLNGQSPSRIAFLREIIESGPQSGMNPIDKWQESRMGGSHAENYFLVYLGRAGGQSWRVAIPAKDRDENLPMPVMQAEFIDCWNMTITPVSMRLSFEQTSRYEWTCRDLEKIELPDFPLLAIRLTPAEQ